MDTETNMWIENNQRYLAAALDWLRLRLSRLVPPAESAAPPAASPAPHEISSRRWWSGREKPQAVTAAPPVLISLDSEPVIIDEQVSQAAARLAEAEASTPPSAMMVLSHAFRLSRFEQEILLLCVAMELDTRIAGYCAHAQDNPQRPYPTFALAMALFDDPEWNALSPEGPLRHWRLIEINQPGAQPLTTSALRADERIVNFLNGVNYLDDRLAPFLLPMPMPGSLTDGSVPPSHQRIAEAILQRLRRANETQRLPITQLIGSDAPSKQLIAQHVAATLGVRLYRLPAELIPTHAADLETLVRLAERESILWPLAIYVEAGDTERQTTSEGSSPPINRFLARSNGVIFLDTRDMRQGLSRDSLAFDIAKPTQAEQRLAWTAILDEESDETATVLASQFNLNLPTIHRIAITAGEEGLTDPTSRREQLWHTCLTALRPQLDGLAQRIEPKVTWDDIVLPETELNLLRQIAAQVRHRSHVYEQWGFAAHRSRGLSINALFAGESGTGKTIAAEVLANDLNLNLYRIDLSAVVNKYIGETEKNLRRLFDAAEDGGVILFFDEADALFGKRSEVKDSHDRYANIEVNYLLQRLESFSGLAIMATNMKSALDTAFLRRIRFVLEFRAHGLAERKAIWQKIFPGETHTVGLDPDRLAKFNLNGGNINNVAINAAFLAAQAGTPVTMPHVLAATRSEFLKLKRPMNEGDFQWNEPEEAAA
jgi:hypothetical protein